MTENAFQMSSQRSPKCQGPEERKSSKTKISKTVRKSGKKGRKRNCNKAVKKSRRRKKKPSILTKGLGPRTSQT